MAEDPIGIGLLADHREAVPTIARWHHDEWGHLAPDVSLEVRAGRLRQRAAGCRVCLSPPASRP